MKNKIIYSILAGAIVVITTLNFFTQKSDALKEEKSQVKKHVDTISMMLETEAGSGNYEMTTSSSWPTEGYVFNSELSKCENGGKLSWDDTNKRVVMNGNKSDKCYVYFDKYNPITINNYSITSNGNSITITIDATAGTGTIAKYLYSKDNGVSYVQSANNTYTFTGLDKGTYNIKAYVQDSNGKNSEIISKTIEITSITLADYVKSLYTGTQGENNIYYHTSTLTNGAGDNSYRYAGANPNNYVCFGSNENPCPTDNLYRIIGVFKDQVKIIKASSAGTKKWNENASFVTNNWASASLNTYLNGTYLSNLGTFTDKIDTMLWKAGGNTYTKVGTSAMYQIYQNEIVSPASAATVSAKLGLMYISDYGYAATQKYWTYRGSGSNPDYSAATSENWLYSGSIEWTITPRSDDSSYAFVIGSSGYIGNGTVTNNSVFRPVFYLSSSVTYISGTGSSALDPILIN